MLKQDCPIPSHTKVDRRCVVTANYVLTPSTRLSTDGVSLDDYNLWTIVSTLLLLTQPAIMIFERLGEFGRSDIYVETSRQECSSRMITASFSHLFGEELPPALCIP